jgi:hypothetical protein
MSQKGGSLFASAVFRKILSIGYEFESHDLAKMSLSRDKKALINSDLTLRTVEGKMAEDDIRVFDENYLTVHLPNDVHHKSPEKEPKTPDVIPEEELRKEDKMDEEEDELYREYAEEFDNEDDNEEEIDEELEAFLEYFEQEEQDDQFREKEKHSYLEYFYEGREKDTEHDKENTKFQLTNDNGETYFSTLLDKKCKALKEKGLKRNNFYLFKTRKGKTYRIHFTDTSMEYCGSFSGLEVVVTYYKPKTERQYVVKSENPNIILDTFVDALSRIVDHFINLKKMRGTFLVADDKLNYSPLGSFDNKRELYYKPGTNLFYMATYDEETLKKTKNLPSMTFSPQMTFRCNAYDALEIMKELLKSESSFKLGKKIISEHKGEQDNLLIVETAVDKLIAKHNIEYPDRIININNNIDKTFRTYLFFILYKVFSYIQGHDEILKVKERLTEGEDKTYLKDYLSFASRHSNAVLYQRVKELAQELYGITDIKEIQDLLFDETICNEFFESQEMAEDDFDEDGNYKYGDPLKNHLKKGEPNYGDPMYSLSSYFDYFETHTEDESDDWFIEAKLDIFSTTFDLNDDKILLENRYFANEFVLFAKNVLSRKYRGNWLTLNDMLNITNKYYEPSKMKKMKNMEYNPIKRKLVKKCKPGFIRSINFKCMIPGIKLNRGRSRKKSKTRRSKKSNQSNGSIKRTSHYHQRTKKVKHRR